MSDSTEGTDGVPSPTGLLSSDGSGVRTEGCQGSVFRPVQSPRTAGDEASKQTGTDPIPPIKTSPTLIPRNFRWFGLSWPTFPPRQA